MDDYVPHIYREKQRKRGHMKWINILIFVLVPLLIFLCFAEDNYNFRKKISIMNFFFENFKQYYNYRFNNKCHFKYPCII